MKYSISFGKISKIHTGDQVTKKLYGSIYLIHPNTIIPVYINNVNDMSY